MSKQAITFKRKSHPSDATRSQRRRTQKRRQQSARQQRWRDGTTMIRYVLSNILNEDEDAYIRSKIEVVCKDVDRYTKAKQTDEQIVLKAIRSGCWTIEDIQDETGFTSKFVRELLAELQRAGKVVFKDNLYRTFQD